MFELAMAIGFMIGWGACAAINFCRRQSLLDQIRFLESDKEDLEAELIHRIMVDRRHETLPNTNYVNLNRPNWN